MVAINQCLINLPTTAFSKFLIFTDSQTSLRKLQADENPNTDALTSQTQFILNQLAQQDITIVLTWIPGHRDIIGQDLVDAAAKSKPETTIPPLNNPDIKAYLHQQIMALWNEEWTHTTDNELRSIKSDISNWTNIFSTLCATSRSTETTINRIFLGHSRLTHEYIFLHQPPPICNLCSTPLTILHIIQHCKSYSRNHRIQYLQIDNVQHLITLINRNNRSHLI
jgi:hypothetical protein